MDKQELVTDLKDCRRALIDTFGFVAEGRIVNVINRAIAYINEAPQPEKPGLVISPEMREAGYRAYGRTLYLDPVALATENIRRDVAAQGWAEKSEYIFKVMLDARQGEK